MVESFTKVFVVKNGEAMVLMICKDLKPTYVLVISNIKRSYSTMLAFEHWWRMH